jgi:hypothetical protein
MELNKGSDKIREASVNLGRLLSAAQARPGILTPADAGTVRPKPLVMKPRSKTPFQLSLSTF